MADDSARVPAVLREEESFLALAETLSSLIVLIEGDRIVYINPAGSTLLGYPQSELKDRDFWDFAFPEDRERIIDRGRSRQQGVEQPRRFVERLRHSKGHAIWVDYSVDRIELAGRKMTLVTGLDMTERKKAEETLRQSEALFRGLFLQSPVMMSSVGKDHRIREVSDYLLKKLGYERQELVGRNSWECLAPESIQRFAAIIQEKHKIGEWQCKDVPLQMFRKDGTVMDILLSSVAELDERGEPAGWITVAQDLSEINLAQKALLQSEERFRTLFTSSPVMMCAVDLEDHFTEMSDHWARKLGYAPSELIGRKTWAITAPESVARFGAIVEQKKQSRDWDIKDVPIQLIRKDGSFLDILLTCVPELGPTGDPLRWLCVALDLSEIKSVQQALHRSEERFAAAFENAAIGKAITGVNMQFLQVNQALCDMLGYAREDLLGVSPRTVTHPDDWDEGRDQVLELVEGKAASCSLIKRYLHKGGHVVWGSLTTTLVRDAEGQPAYFVTEVVDITERKRAEDLLRDREAKLAEAQRVAQVGSWEYHIASNTSTWSDEMYRIFGADPATFNPSKENAFQRFHPEDLPQVAAIVEKALKDGEPFGYDSRIIQPNGAVRTLHTIGRSHRNAAGQPVSLYGTLQDITERKKVEELLRDREAKLADAQAIAHVGSWEYDLHTYQIVWSDEMYRIWGVDPSGFDSTLQGVVSRIHPKDQARTWEVIEQALKEAKPFQYEYAVIRDSGETRELWSSGRIEIDKEGKPSRIYGITQDITERKRFEATILDREAKLAEAQRIAHIGSWEWDIATGRMGWSDELFRILGLDPASASPSYDGYMGRVHPDDRADLEALVGRAQTEGAPYESEHRIVRDDGEVRTMWASCRLHRDADGRTARMYGIAQDITDRKKALDALRTSELRFRNLYSQAPVMMTAMDPEGRIREVSNYWLQVMGYDRDEVIGREGFKFVTAGSKQCLEEGLAETLMSGERVIRNVPMTGLKKDGSTIEVLVTSVLETTPQGQPLGAITVGVDVSDIRRAEEAVRESEARYRALVEHAPEAIGVLDVETGKFIDANGNAETMFGYSREKLLTMGPLDFCPQTQPGGGLSHDVAWDQIGRVMKGETPVFEFVHTHSSGREIPCQVRLSRLPATGQNLVRATLTDISDLKAMEEKVRHAEKMAAVGLLAAGVAHEIGNPLLALSMAAQSLERKLADEYAQKKLGLIREHIDRISRIVRQMSDLARPAGLQRSSCDVNRVLERTLEVVRYDKRAKEVRISFEPCRDIPFVLAVEDQLIQVCLNLALNALDAVAANPPSRPKSLVLSARCIRKDGRKVVRAAFQDSGPGIPEASRARIFQPFFTTKSTGKGTGLGLSVSYRIIEEHQGTLGFDCGAKDGTEFYFELPVQEKS